MADNVGNIMNELLSDLITNKGTYNQQDQNTSIPYKDTNHEKSTTIPYGLSCS